MKNLPVWLWAIFYVIYASCYAQNAPVSTAGSVATFGATATIPITATNFTNIGSCSLKLTYNSSIAIATLVTTGPLLGGTLSSNLTVPGEIILGWFTSPGKTLPDNTVIFNIQFSKVASGVSPVAWIDDGYSCEYSDGNFNVLNDIPTSSYYFDGLLTFQSNDAPVTKLPALESCGGIAVEVPVSVGSFYNIGKLALNIQYNSANLTYQSWINNSNFPGLTVNSSTLGTIIVTGTVPVSDPGFTLADGSFLFTLIFSYGGGISSLNWFDNGASCQYNGPPPGYTVLNDIPQSQFYYNGSITELPLPGAAGSISGPPGGIVCQGESNVTFSILPIPNASNYHWSLPPGAEITSGANTNSITVSFTANALSGETTVYGSSECGNGAISPPFPLTLNSAPFIAAQPISPAAVQAGTGTASFTVSAIGTELSYQWQEYIVSWNDIINGGVYNGATSPTLTISMPPLTMDGFRYRCVVDGFCLPEVITDGAAMLTVSPIIGINNEESEITELTVYPNPVIRGSKISFRIPDWSEITVALINILGETTFRKHEKTNGGELYSFIIPDDLPGKGIILLNIIISHDGKFYTTQKKIIYRE